MFSHRFFFFLSPFRLIQVFKFQISSLSLSFILGLGKHITAIGHVYYIKKVITKKTKVIKKQEHPKAYV